MYYRKCKTTTSLEMLLSNFAFKILKFSSVKFYVKKKALNFAVKMLYLAIFRLEL